MSDIDVPAGEAGGLNNVSASPELPARLRVHALAKLISTTSRQVLDTLIELGAPAKGVQSSIDRETAERVIEKLAPEGLETPSSAAVEPASETSVEQASEPPAVPAFDEPNPAGNAPLGLFAAGASTSVTQDEPAAEASGALPLFAAPSPMFLPPEPPAARKPARRSAPVEPEPLPSVESAGEDDEDDSTDSSDDGGDTKRRRRRGRRGRGRGKGTEDGTDEDNSDSSASDDAPTSEGDEATTRSANAEDDDQDTEDDADDSADNSGDESGGGSRRRRRRRRRKDGDSSSDSSDNDTDDPPNTVTKVREPRSKSDGDSSDNGNQGIQGVRGSTRLEAKRQRRRDGRDAGRRRAPVLSEAEFLARRESVERTMVVRQRGERSEVGVLEDGVLVEHFVTSSGGTSLVGNVYLGRVQNVLPSMEAAFVDIGRGRNAVLYAGEVDWDAAGLAGKARRIEQALSSGDSILVQVTKDPIGHKGARLTTQISLPGRFLVYVPSGGTHGISRKLPDTERRRLKDLLKEIVPDDAGVIIRTASEGVSQEALERDVRRLQAQWDVVKTKADAAKGSSKSKSPELLYEEPDLMIKVVRDQFNEDFATLVVEGDDAWDTLHAYVSHVAPELTERLNRHVGTSDVFTEHRIDEQLMKALDRKVWLPSGGTLVIDRTEAMTVIDVNTGKFTGSGGNLEETVTRNNLEAAEEIVRQLRLRDIGGIIVIDFIDMVLESNRDLVLRRLTECLGRDRTRHQVAEVTSLGLVQMTRKRVGVGLLEAFSTPCEHCRGRGVVVSADPVEPRGDGGAPHGSGGGRRRGRGGDHNDSGSGNSGGSGSGGSGNGGGGQNGNGNGNNGGNGNGRRKGGGSHGSAPSATTASETETVSGEAEHAATASNGTTVHATPPRQLAGVAVVAAATGHATATKADEAPAALAEESRPSTHTEEAATPAATTEAVEQPDTVEAPSASVAPPQEAPSAELAAPSAQPEPEPVAPPTPAETSARPARRRRRAASRPAGPPVVGE